MTKQLLGVGRRHYLCCDVIGDEHAPLMAICEHVCPSCGTPAPDKTLSHTINWLCIDGTTREVRESCGVRQRA